MFNLEKDEESEEDRSARNEEALDAGEVDYI